MATVVALMDRDSFEADTDVLVIVDPGERTLLWVPRDLWCEALGDRVNRAFALGGQALLGSALAEHGITAGHGICLLRRAVEAGLAGLTVTMSVRRRLEFWYPLEPRRPIEEGRKRIVFEPPIERLSAERIHQWMGARYAVEGPDGDLGRIQRQQELIAVLGDGFDFARFLDGVGDIRVSGKAAIHEVAQARWNWAFKIMGGLEPAKLRGKEVLMGAG